MTTSFEHSSLVDLEEKAVREDGDNYVLTGYGAVFNNVDLGNDVIEPGAFSKSLREHGLPLLLFNHKMDDAPIGTIVDAKEDRKGLWYKAELPKSDSFVAGRIVPQLKNRGLKSNSIGYRATRSEKRKDGVRALKEIRLFEISVVNMAMNPLANVENIKGVLPFGDLFIDRNVKTWDADAVFKSLVEKYADTPDEIRSCFLYVDEDKSPAEWDAKLLIGDIDEKGRIATNPIALYRCVACVVGARGGIELPEAAETAVKSTLDRYYSKLGLEAPFSRLSSDEFENLRPGELEVRLKGLGISGKLATHMIGLRDADRKPVQRDAGSKEDREALLAALTKFVNGTAIST